MIGEVTLSSGRKAQYYVDARRMLLLRGAVPGDRRAGCEEAARLGASAVGGPVMGAIPIACAAIGAAPGDALKAFFVRKERKEHGLQRWIEGPEIDRASACWWSRTRSRRAARSSRRSSG